MRDWKARQGLHQISVWEEVRIQREVDPRLREPVERRARELDQLWVSGERRLFDVHERRSRGLQTAQFSRERICDGERPLFEVPVVGVLCGERRECEGTADRGLELALRDRLRLREVRDERPAVGLDRAGDHRLPEIGVVVVEPLERSALAVAPGAREPSEQVVPADLAVVDHVDARALDLTHRPRGRGVENAGESRVVQLAAILLVQRAPQVLVLVGDLRVRTHHRRFHADFDSFTFGRG